MWLYNSSKYCDVSLTIQLNVSHLFALNLNVKTVLFDTLIKLFQVIPLWARVDLGTTATKEYSKFPKVFRLEPFH